MAKRAASGKRNRRRAGEDAELELSTGVEPFQACKGSAFDSQVNLVVINYRHRLCDEDGSSPKAAIDGCVDRGILFDDSAAYIKEVRNWQVKVGSQDQEKTLLVFVPVNLKGVSK